MADIDIDRLAAEVGGRLRDDDQFANEVASQLTTGSYGDRVLLSRRQLIAATTGLVGAATLMTWGVDEATAQQLSGEVQAQTGTFGDVSAESVSAGAIDVETGGETAQHLGGAVDYLPNQTADTSGSVIFTGGEFGSSYLLVVFGFDGSGNRFRDIVSFTSKLSVPPSRIDHETEGVASTSYNRVNDNLELTMGTGTFSVGVASVGLLADVTS